MNEKAGAATPRDETTTAAELQPALEQAAQMIHRAGRVVVTTHARPDGDAVGATLGTALLLEALGKGVGAFGLDPIPYNFRFLPGAHLWRQGALPTSLERPDLTILLDCGARHRVGAEAPDVLWGAEVLAIDHHKKWQRSDADHWVRDVRAPATAELILRLVDTLGASLSLPLAECLYCGLMTDTGGFRYRSATPRAFRAAATLVEAGVDPWRMTSHVYESQPLQRVELLAQVLQTLRLLVQGKLAVLRIERSMIDEDEARVEALTDGFINQARAIEGVEVAAQMKERAGQNWEVTFRSRGKVDIGPLAAALGGQGGRNAGRCVLQGSHAEVEARLAEALRQVLPGDGARGAADEERG